MTIRSLNESGQELRTAPAEVGEAKSKRSKTGMALFGLFVLGATATVLYFTFSPTVCPVLYRVSEEVLIAPAAGELCFLAPNGPIRKGALAAELRIDADTGGAYLERLRAMQERLRRLAEAETARTDELDELEKEVAGLRRDLPLAQAEEELAAFVLNRSETWRDGRKKQLDAVARLFELEAIRNSELVAAEEQFSAAAAEVGKAALQRKIAALRVDSLQRNLAAAEQRLNRRSAAAAAGSADAALAEQLSGQLSGAQFVPGGVRVRFSAAGNGTFLGGGATVPRRVAENDVLARIFSATGGELTVYLPESVAQDVSASTQFRVDIGGRKFIASVRDCPSLLSSLPAPLRGRSGDPNAQYRPVVLRLPPEAPELLNGQTGHAIMR